VRGSYNEHLARHAAVFLLAFARRFDHYLPQKRLAARPRVDRSPGEDGGEAAKLCAVHAKALPTCRLSRRASGLTAKASVALAAVRGDRMVVGCAASDRETTADVSMRVAPSPILRLPLFTAFSTIRIQ
jgi:hypothetical protein